MAPLKRHLGLLCAIFAAVACTDGRKPVAPPIQRMDATPPARTNAAAVTEIKFNGQNMEVMQMIVKSNALYLTGRPFGFMRADVGSNAEQPEKTFAIKEMIDHVMGRWVLDWYASGALTVIGQYAVMSGVVGVSMFDLTETNSPREFRRYPRENEDTNNNNTIQDAAYTYKALVAHPSQPVLYGFREQDFVYTLGLTNGPGLRLLNKSSYAGAGATKCCVRGATVWKNKVFVAFRGSLVWFELGSSGSLGSGGEVKFLQAEAIASSEKYLFVYHNPGQANPQGANYARGIYVFDEAGKAVALLNTDSPRVMAATNDYVYINSDNTSVKVYKIDWH